MKQPFFVSFDGIDGCGKSTQLRLLASGLRGRGRSVVTVRDPGGTALSEKIRKIILSPASRRLGRRGELLLYQASRAQLVEEKIRPALAAGKIVLCDRFTHATYAYQGAGRRLGRTDIRWLNRFATGGLVPDLTFVLDLSPDEAFARQRHTGKIPDRMEKETTAFFRRVRAGFVAQARECPRRIILLRAHRPVPEIQAEIRKRLWARLGLSKNTIKN